MLVLSGVKTKESSGHVEVKLNMKTQEEMTGSQRADMLMLDGTLQQTVAKQICERKKDTQEEATKGSLQLRYKRN